MMLIFDIQHLVVKKNNKENNQRARCSTSERAAWRHPLDRDATSTFQPKEEGADYEWIGKRWGKRRPLRRSNADGL